MITQEEINNLKEDDNVFIINEDKTDITRVNKSMLNAKDRRCIYSNIYKIFNVNTHESIVHAFGRDFINNRIQDRINKQKQEQEDQEIKRITEINNLLNIDYNSLKGIEKARIIKIINQLNKKCNFSEVGIMTYKEFFQNHIYKVDCVLRDDMINYNRIKYNRMQEREQDKYIKRLETKTLKYQAYLKDGTFFYINKLLFDSFRYMNHGLNLKL